MRRKAYVPHLCVFSTSRADAHSGRNSIFVSDVYDDHTLSPPLVEVPAHRDHDAPRHNVPSPDGRTLYSVTEHTSYVDVWEVYEEDLVWRQSVSIIPSAAGRDDFRGDTLRLSRDGKYLFASTRGKTEKTRGWVAVWTVDQKTGRLFESGGALHRYQTPTSGGKANAIEPALKGTPLSDRGEQWLVLTDDEQGYVFILGFDGSAINEVARLQLPGSELASHAIWLS